MQALRLTAWQHEAELLEVADPEPGPGEVLVKIGGAGACHSDLHLMDEFSEGMVGFEPPFTLGHENAGWVAATGAGVVGLEVGTPVAVYGPWGCGHCHRCRMGMENYCEHQGAIGAMGGGLGRDGGMATYMVVPSPRHLVPLGDLDPVHAAPLTDAGLTPYHAVRRSLSLLVPGSTACVIGAGGLGHMAVQILRVLTPATVVAVDTRREALALAADAGAQHVVSVEEDPAAALAEVSKGRGADVVFDFVGSDETLALAARAVRQLGHLTIVGLAGGKLPIGFFGIAYEASVATTYWGSLPELDEVLALAAGHHIKAEITTYPLSHANDAYAALRRGSSAGGRSSSRRAPARPTGSPWRRRARRCVDRGAPRRRLADLRSPSPGRQRGRGRTLARRDERGG
ncbi:MAG TPA: NAD(P)-dependent alcohol dehydrogenase [Acidimicrobiales bacterium]|nr:NAD(P)-dependent alcohol dehydrogenase [Acidimicrobiales bacterium]